MMIPTSVAFLLAGGVVLSATPRVRSTALKKGWLDLPDNERKLHQRVVPRLGGVAIAAGVAVGGACLLVAGAVPSGDLLPLFGGAAVLWAVGLWDDLYELGFKRKFLFQLLAAYGLLLAGWRLDLAPLPVVGELDLYGQALLAVPVSIVWIVGVVNAVNLTDGQDGLASGVSMAAFLALGAMAYAQGQGELAAFCLVASGALAAFLVFNWAPASIFMGDSGSLLLGFLLAGVSLRVADAATTALGLLAPVLVLGLPILDTLSCMVRRVLEGRSPFAPDADHIHHRMTRAAGSVRLGVAALWAVAAAYGVLGVLASVGSFAVALAAALAVVPLSYLLLRQLSYVRVRVLLRQAQRRWLNRRRSMLDGERPSRRPLFVPPPVARAAAAGAAAPVGSDDGLRLMEAAWANAVLSRTEPEEEPERALAA